MDPTRPTSDKPPPPPASGENPVPSPAADALVPRSAAPPPLAGRAAPLTPPPNPLAEKLSQDLNPSHWKVVGDVVHYYPKGKPLFGNGNPEIYTIQELRAALITPRTLCFFNKYIAPTAVPFHDLLLSDPDPSHWRVYKDANEKTFIQYYANSRDRPLLGGHGNPLYEQEISKAKETVRLQARAIMKRCTHSPLDQARQEWQRAERLTTLWNRIVPSDLATTPQERRLESEERLYQTWGALARTLGHPADVDVDCSKCTCIFEAGELFLVHEESLDDETGYVLIENTHIPLMALISHLEKPPVQKERVEALKLYLQEQQNQALHPQMRLQLARALQRCDWLLTPPPPRSAEAKPVPDRQRPPAREHFSAADQERAETQEATLHEHFEQARRDSRKANPGKIPEPKRSERIDPPLLPPEVVYDHRSGPLRSLGDPPEHWKMERGQIQYNHQSIRFTYSPEEVRDYLVLQLTTLNEELDEEVMTLHQANKLKTPENVSGRVEEHLQNIQKRYQKICTQIIQFNTLTHNRFPPAVNALQETFESLIASGKVEHETFAESTRRNHLNKEARVQEHRTIQRLLSKPLDPAATLSWYYDTCRLTQDSKRVTLQSVLSQIEHSCEAKDPETQALCRAQLEHLKKLLTDEPQLVHAHYHPSIQRHLQTCEKLLERLNNLA